MRNASGKTAQKIKTYILCSNTFYKSFRVRDNVEKHCTVGQTRGDSAAHAYFMLYTYGYKHNSEYVIFIAFPSQQWLHERASVLRYTYIVRLV